MKELYTLFISDKVELLCLYKSELGYKRYISSFKPYAIRFSELEDFLKDGKSLIEVVLKDKTEKSFRK
tara:strand:+ start:264 stop:467 length:204 start_codon:yes stop_codon:yes gene_type:complete